ncbi:N-acetylmuramoyl-L-alanine amidase [Dysgonomonas sp. 25]|uniref:N-acetylmuramoyl-L-alanine amidase n=1 Tax=Dysgonomonas sp. 25 TaxID=2302933 RepID=UPI0013D216AA|nr:N-acetylmuramoyl-L-alanine amidase [Dysgonomonas sp. 25]NDV69268.1 N-acetylmuramoyl-L-alanine amidase [Dysgonomonas sp. 25]
MRKIDKIIIHCSATKVGQDFSAKDIDSWHRARGFRKIGYHYVIDLDGAIETGRNEDEIGAHCVGQNVTSIGICYIGGLDENGKPCDTRTPAQKVALNNLIAEITNRHPNLTIHGHKEFANKACPCFDVTKEFSL